MPIGPARMPLFDHLGELRMRLVRIVAALFIAMCIFYMASPTIIQFMGQPVKDFLPTDENGMIVLNILDVFGAFTIRFKVSLWAAVVACMPIILWQILAFFLPALRPNERKWFIPTFAVAVALFIFGTVFCYLFILHPACEWLTEQAGGFAQIFPDAKSWIDTIINFELCFGVAFELPLVVFYLVIFDIVPYAKLRASWRTVYIVLMVISAVATPDASPITMFLMFGAMIVLYEASLLVARVVLRKRVAKKAAEEAAELAETEQMKAEWKATKKTARAKLDAHLSDDEDE